MDCELLLVSDLDSRTLKNTVYSIVRDIVEGKVTSYDDLSRLCCEYFTIDIETEEIISLDFIREEYGMQINSEIRIQLFGKAFHNGLEQLFRIFGGIINSFNPDMVFLENGTDQLFRKEKNMVIVNTKLDDNQQKYLSPKIIGYLNCSYIYRDLSHH
ncbi:hypothetical protein [Paenibacillus tarimensis]|uniref:hypothetical protein n=1 Tax=Paenibacillus tarimensis TaxID=416012 RepID=UPI001F2B26C3|nr:hypothetical protein [Paenibacillus tarimensis]MCF2945424.1 hypothetical protein [Paenibacillus tarimensis]